MRDRLQFLPLFGQDAPRGVVRVVQDALGDFIVDQLLTVKRAEWEDYRRYVSPWELAHYGDA